MALRKCALIAAALAVLLAPVARADEATKARLEALKQRLDALENKLDSREATVEAQRELLNRSSESLPAVSQGSGIDAFFSKLEVGGHVTGSYAYAFNRPSKTTGAAIVSQPLNQFNVNHNTFSLDAVKLEVGRPTEGRGTAGFQLDLLFGANNNSLSSTTAIFPADAGVFVQEAYVAYDWRDVVFKFGKFETLLGYEVLDSPKNHHVSHGLLFTWAIPLFHTGILASGDINENVGWAAGLTNGFNNALDTNENKGLLAQLRFSEGPLFASLQTYYGVDRPTSPALPVAANVYTTVNDNMSDQLIVDFVGTFKPTDAMTLWVNGDWGQQENLLTTAGPCPPCSFEDTDWWGVGAGAAVSLSEKISFAVRGEYLSDENGARLPRSALVAAPAFGVPEGDLDAYSLTSTLGYALTPNLLTRAEIRFDRVGVNGKRDQIFASGTPAVDFEQDALTGYLEVSYSFD